MSGAAGVPVIRALYVINGIGRWEAKVDACRYDWMWLRWVSIWRLFL